jgi:membrane protein DedA with SNARE-associated domain
LRVTAAWLAGISRMPWWRFLAWNASGGVIWAALVGSIAYYFGKAAADAIGRYGVYAGVAIALGALLVLLAAHRLRKRALES